MPRATVERALSEPQFAALVDTLAADPARRDELTGLLREDHPAYRQRGSAAIVSMRGWVLLALARAPLPEDALIFVLEELDTGVDAYLVAAAAIALRSCPRPNETLAPFVMRALTNARYRDTPVSLERYGEHATASAGTSPMRELFATLAWLGPHARGVLDELETLRAQGNLPRKLRLDLDRALQAIRGEGARSCCGETPAGAGNVTFVAPEQRRAADPAGALMLQDHAGEQIAFREFFGGQPSIVVFFYTRCDNPMKCSLTIAKLARVQKRLEERGLAGSIRTAAITYDPAFDLPARLAVYGRDRGVRMDAHHRMLRTMHDFDALRRHFELGVNFVESLVNRHRIEVFVLDGEARLAVCFERIHWDEGDVIARAEALLNERLPSAEPQSLSRRAG